MASLSGFQADHAPYTQAVEEAKTVVHISSKPHRRPSKLCTSYRVLRGDCNGCASHIEVSKRAKQIVHLMSELESDDKKRLPLTKFIGWYRAQQLIFS